MSDAKEREQLFRDANKLVRDAGIILEEAPVETELHAVAARMSGAGVRISKALRALRDSEGRELASRFGRQLIEVLRALNREFGEYGMNTLDTSLDAPSDILLALKGRGPIIREMRRRQEAESGTDTGEEGE